jgi:rRNA maturation protein Nop10
MKCIFCGHEQTGDARFCNGCGLAFPAFIAGESASPPGPALPVLPPSLTCPQCGTSTSDAFCPACGIKVRLSTPPRPEAPKRGEEGHAACRTCGQMTDRSVCPICGTRLTVG